MPLVFRCFLCIESSDQQGNNHNARTSSICPGAIIHRQRKYTIVTTPRAKHLVAQYRRSRSGRPAAIRSAAKPRTEIERSGQEFAPAWRCRSCSRRWPPSNSMADWGTAAGLRQDQTARKEQGWGISSCLLPPFPCSAGAICFSLRFFPIRKKVFPL